MTLEPIAHDDEDVELLRGNGYRVHPRTYVVHTAWCRTQEPIWHPEMLPWPKYADDEDRPCKVCKPNLAELVPPA